jgi:predicted ATPase
VLDFIFGMEYLLPKYQLQWFGKDLDELSPGERGTLLLIFYLLIDKRDVPLIIDQPEENLDNQTVYKVLVPCLREARERRQVIIVTHNPNLAVVCDADQVIHCQIDKKNKNRVTYTLGALENPTVNHFTIDVLEGTRPAFDHRDAKYQIQPTVTSKAAKP